MFKKTVLVLLAVAGLSVAGCCLPSWLGGGSKDAKVEAKK